MNCELFDENNALELLRMFFKRVCLNDFQVSVWKVIEDNDISTVTKHFLLLYQKNNVRLVVKLSLISLNVVYGVISNWFKC